VLLSDMFKITFTVCLVLFGAVEPACYASRPPDPFETLDACDTFGRYLVNVGPPPSALGEISTDVTAMSIWYQCDEIPKA
jgi:hypothetical protein